MKRIQNFWQSLEAYGWVLVRRSPLPYPWIGVGLVVLMAITSVASVKNSVVGTRNEREVIERAARVGDYEKARELYDSRYDLGVRSEVLGAESELEELVYPEQKLEQEIVRWEGELDQYPGNREIMRVLEKLYGQAGNVERAAELREQIRILDPNE